MRYLSYIFVLLMFGCASPTPKGDQEVAATKPESLQNKIERITASASADVGVVIIGPDGDTIKVHADKPYRMQSVAKFPQALRLLSMLDDGKLPVDYRFKVTDKEMKQRTYSTLPKDHPVCPFELTVREALEYSIGQSDNVMSNMIFDVEGGPEAVEQFMRELGIEGIGVKVDYWHLTDETAYSNWSTPMAMAKLLELFYQGKILSQENRAMLFDVMVKGPSGKNRLRGKLRETMAIAHKTGTGNTDDSTGRIMALNDVGIIELGDGRHITIAVFVSDSFAGDEATAEIIADVAKEAVRWYGGE